MVDTAIPIPTYLTTRYTTYVVICIAGTIHIYNIENHSNENVIAAASERFIFA